jgi:hypothetical protein
VVREWEARAVHNRRIIDNPPREVLEEPANKDRLPRALLQEVHKRDGALVALTSRWPQRPEMQIVDNLPQVGQELGVRLAHHRQTVSNPPRGVLEGRDRRDR